MIPMEPVTGPAVWNASDIARRSDWKVQFEPAAAKELPSLLEYCRANPVSEQVGAERFPALHRQMQSIRNDLLHGAGFALLRGFPVEQYPTSAVEALFLALGKLVGKPISQNSYGDVLGHVRDEGKRITTVGETKGVRGYLSNEKLLFHTDLGDAVGLLCIKQAKEGGMSSMSSSMSVYNEILASRPDLLPPLFNGFLLRSTEADGVPVEWRLPVYSYDNGVLSCAIRRAMIETSRLNGVPYTSQENEALEYLDAVAARPDLRYDMKMEPGDIQFLNNYVTFHSRTEFVDFEELEQKRHMLRLWLQFPGGRAHMAKYPVLYDGVPATLVREQKLAMS
ncbi:Taurine catabolism dioxygenase TauD, TfdA family (plasmid) [Variovorax sp. SRS16]|uniref:TauD/TfdA family dioxygenase n=1 Tax=Variovorax sp. SRS16 TaxID=282217 RepID=UPI001317F72B|nr:TauD/TfdA family dioxygenase [Variovorax sp. SRS16]VTU45390.1 Taurine catabolism dioxygenase TauD, TfdA family [Variovorax sp. SRS16]